MYFNILSIFTFFIFTACSQTEPEKRIKVAIIDTGVSVEQSKQPYMCQNGVRTKIPNDDGIAAHPHGVNITGIISEGINPKTHCIVSYKVYHDRSIPEIDDYVSESMEDIKEDKSVMFVNQSMGGGSFSSSEYSSTVSILKRGAIITVAAGNEMTHLDITSCNLYPVCYARILKNPNFKTVGSLTKNSRGLMYTNFGPIVSDWEIGFGGNPVIHGTSQASANLMKKILLQR